MNTSISINFDRSSSAYDIEIAAGALSNIGEWASSALGGKIGKLALITNRKVDRLYGERVSESFVSAGFDVRTFHVGDGERFKSLKTFEKVISFLSTSQIKRTDAVVALGGGVVGDLAGFAASIYMRGIPFLQIPTTLLSMIDSSVGGKTGVNTAFGKNLVGSFYQPAGVMIDPLTLETLPRRELTAGFCEAIKHGAISGYDLFNNVNDFLMAQPIGRFGKGFVVSGELQSLIAKQVQFKAYIVSGDERESIVNDSASSRKILNFGHTLAHALENATGYKYLKHGEAVGYGVLFAASLSKKLDLINKSELQLLNDVVHRAGILPPIRHLNPSEVLEPLKQDKKIVNDSLQWILLSGIGNPVIVPHADIPKSVLVSSLDELIHHQ